MSDAFKKKNPKEEPILPRVPNQRLGLIARREETRLNSLLLKDKDLLADCISSGISYRFFEDDVQRQIFGIIAKYYDSHNSLLTRQQFESIVTQMPVDEVAASYRNAFDTVWIEQVSAQDYNALKSNMEGRHLQRQTLAVFTKFYDQIIQATAGQKKLVEAIQNDIAAIQSLGGNKYNRTASLAETIQKEVLPELLERRNHPENFYGMMTGFSEIDKDFHGLKRGRYLVVLAMEGGGKTTFMLNLARNFAVFGRNVVYITIESGLKDTSLRMLTIHSSVSYNRIMAGGKDNERGLCDFIMQELNAAADDLIRGPGSRLHWVQVIDGTSRSEIINLVNRKRAYVDIDVVILDYLGVVGKEKSYSTRPDLELADISSKFRSWAMESDLLFCTAQQMKTDKSKKLGDTTPDKYETERIHITDVSGTKEIAGAADYMLGVYIPDTRDRMKVYNVKHRQGWAGKSYTLALDIESGRLSDFPSSVGCNDADVGLRGSENRSKIDKGDAVQGSPSSDAGEALAVPDESPLDLPRASVIQDFAPDPIPEAEQANPPEEEAKPPEAKPPEAKPPEAKPLEILTPPAPNPDLPPAFEMEPF